VGRRGSPAGSRVFPRQPGKDIASKKVFLLGHLFLSSAASLIIIIINTLQQKYKACGM
jgi:hypothetical protein